MIGLQLYHAAYNRPAAAVQGAVRGRPAHEYAQDFSPALLEKTATIRDGQQWIVGTSYLARVGKIQKLVNAPDGAGTVAAAEGHEFLRFEMELIHMFGCSGVGVTSGKGILVSLAYRDGYDSEPARVSAGGVCNISPNEVIPVGWQSKAVCQFYYNRSWEPRYLVLSFVDQAGTHPAAKIDVGG